MPNRWRQLESNQTARLCVFDVRSGQTRLVHESAEAVFEAPNWTPDGAWLIYNQDGLIYRMAADGDGGAALIDTGDVRDCNNDHVLSPDGSFVYVSSGDGHLYEVPLAGGAPRRVSNVHPEPFRYFLHGISSDGATLAYTGAEVVGGNAFGSLEIFTIPVAGGADTQLTRSGRPTDGAEYSPDGRWIYFNSEMASSTPGHAQLFRMRLDGTEVTQLTDDERVNWFPHLSPDGGRLVYVSYEPGVRGHPANKDVIIRAMDPDGGDSQDLVALVGGQGTINVNSWAPDSCRFAYVEYPHDVAGVSAESIDVPIEQRSLGAKGPPVSFVGLGALEIGRDWGLGDETARRRCDEPTALAVVDRALELGITCIDTARAYHRSEERLGVALAGHRSEVFLATKCGEHDAEPDTFYDFGRAAIRRSIDQSLTALQTDWVDLLQIHWGPAEHEQALWEETVPEMQAARDAGKVRLLGASCPTGRIERCISSGVFDVLQVSYHLLERSAEPGIEAAAASGLGILVRDGLGAGRLSPRVCNVLDQDLSLAGRIRPLLDLLGAAEHGPEAAAARLPALGLAFLRRNPAVGSVLVGTKSVTHLTDDVAAAAEDLDPGLVDEAIRLSATP